MHRILAGSAPQTNLQFIYSTTYRHCRKLVILFFDYSVCCVYNEHMFDGISQETPLHWVGKAIGLLDLDAFFASIEQLDHPAWRGLPVIVGGSPSKRGVVSTASYEARRYGVHSAMASATAERLCPDAIWTSGNFRRYREMSAKVMAILIDETPLVEQVSIDEAFFDITPGRYSREEPYEICTRIQARVSELGISCSVGVGTTKSIAKIASERDKPRGLTIVFPGSEQGFLAPLPIRSLSGIGPRAEKALSALGIKTLGQLARASDADLMRVFGSSAKAMRMRSLGMDESAVASVFADDAPKSVSCERTFEADLYDAGEIEAAIMHVAALTGRRLRKKGLKGSTVTLKIKHSPTSLHTAQMHLPTPSDDEHLFGTYAKDLLPRVWEEGQPVRLIGVGISHLAGQGSAPCLFDGRNARLGKLSKATDLVKERFGDDAIRYGRDLRFAERVSNTAPLGKADA